MRNLFQVLRKRILNLDASVTEEILKIYIAYKTDYKFCGCCSAKIAVSPYTQYKIWGYSGSQRIVHRRYR